MKRESFDIGYDTEYRGDTDPLYGTPDVFQSYSTTYPFADGYNRLVASVWGSVSTPATTELIIDVKDFTVKVLRQRPTPSVSQYQKKMGIDNPTYYIASAEEHITQKLLLMAISFEPQD